MTYFGSTEWYQRVAQGLVNGFSIQHIVGHNLDVGTSAEKITPEGIWYQGSSASTVRIKAGGDANDTAAGTGARSVVIEGLDSSGDAASETIATAGASASSATTTSFLRINKAYVSNSGAYGGTNAAAITIEDSGGSADWAVIDSGDGEAHIGAYSIPSGYEAWLLSFSLHVDTTKTVDAEFLTQDRITTTSAPFGVKRKRIIAEGMVDSFTDDLIAPFKLTGSDITAPLDFWWEAVADVSGKPVAVEFAILLQDTN